jgi:ABC-type transport system involved in multi-copper enzyme maturation permease subunit
MNKTTFHKSTRIILAIASKDIIDALKNRTLLMIVIGVLLLMLTNPALTWLVNRNRPVLVIYSPEMPVILQSLESRGDLRLVLVDSLEQMQADVLQPKQTIIGVIVPTGVGEDLHGEVTLEGYTAHWVSQSEGRERVRFFEAALSEASGRRVNINIEGNRLYPAQSDSYMFTMISLSLTTMILLMGLVLVPYLFIEEKESHTLEALLVSPVHFWQLVIGKMIAGGVYCLVAAAIVLLFNYRLILHWELMVSAVFVGTCFAVALGLLLGMLFENAASMGLWTSLLTVGLIVPPILQTVGGSKIPGAVQTVMSWMPTSAINKMAVLSMLGEIQQAPIWQAVLPLVGVTIVLCLLVIWRIRQVDR